MNVGWALRTGPEDHKCTAHLPDTVDHHSMAYVGTGDEAGEMTKWSAA